MAFTKEQEKDKRIRITLPPKQKKWLLDFCKTHKISVSKYISWMLAKKAEEMIEILRIDKNTYTEEELDEIVRILRTKWVNVDDE